MAVPPPLISLIDTRHNRTCYKHWGARFTWKRYWTDDAGKETHFAGFWKTKRHTILQDSPIKQSRPHASPNANDSWLPTEHNSLEDPTDARRWVSLGFNPWYHAKIARHIVDIIARPHGRK